LSAADFLSIFLFVDRVELLKKNAANLITNASQHNGAAGLASSL
jgi:hypothetical protein